MQAKLFFTLEPGFMAEAFRRRKASRETVLGEAGFSLLLLIENMWAEARVGAGVAE